jgi:hypothetical protein
MQLKFIFFLLLRATCSPVKIVCGPVAKFNDAYKIIFIKHLKLRYYFGLKIKKTAKYFVATRSAIIF